MRIAAPETSGVLIWRKHPELVTDRDVVGTVEQQIVGGDLCRQRRVFQPRVERRELNVGINPRQRGAGGVDLRLADGGVAVQGLTLQVGERDGVEIEQSKLADARRRQILRAQPSPPRPTTSTREAFSCSWPSKSKSRRIICRLAQHLRIAQLHAHYSPPNR